MLESIIFDDGLRIIDQLELPQRTVYREISTAEEAHDAIKRMVVRGAPAIALVAVAGVAVDVSAYRGDDAVLYAAQRLDYVATARPTAVNLKAACEDVKARVLPASTEQTVRADLMACARAMLRADVAANRQIGAHGLADAQQFLLASSDAQISVVTICNTGSLATAGFGTALGVVRALHAAKRLRRLYVLETRPYNQGARLTAYEAVADGLPATLVTDSMAAAVLARDPSVRLAVVGADRVARNGDTANKIGTMQLAVLARHFGVRFVVAAPTTSVDLRTPSGAEIRIEERPAAELTDINGVRIAAPGIDVWNPAFDVTPAALIDAIVTEHGVFAPEKIADACACAEGHTP